MSIENGCLAMPQKYFQDDMRNYQDTWFCVIRELGQNSLDAGATRIDVAIQELEDKVVRISWKDDGCGMSRETLKSSFLTLGASGKTFVICPECNREHDKSVRKCAGCAWKPAGGFGTAKILICFAQAGYQILSHDYHLTGFSNGFAIEGDKPHVDGCEFIIDLKCACKGCRDYGTCWDGNLTKWDIEEAISLWSTWTTTTCEISVEGKIMPTFASLDIIGTTDATAWAKMTTVDNGSDDPLVIIRMNGQMMGKDTGPEGMRNHVALDVEGDSTQYLTMNRCGFTGKYSTEMNEFLKKLYRDPKMVTRVVEPDIKIFVGTKGSPEMGLTEATRVDRVEALMNNPEALAEAMKALESGDHSGYTMVVRNDTSANIPLKYIPGFMNKSSDKLMSRWIAIILFIGEKMGGSRRFSPGWIFATDAAAMHQGGRLLLNPVRINESGRMTPAYKADVDSFNRLVILAIHEIVHFNGYSYHDNSFNDEFERIAKIVILDNAKDLRKLRASV